MRILDDVRVDSINLGPQIRVAEICLGDIHRVSPRLTVCVAGSGFVGACANSGCGREAPIANAHTPRRESEFRAAGCGHPARA